MTIQNQFNQLPATQANHAKQQAKSNVKVKSQLIYQKTILKRIIKPSSFQA